MAICSIRTLEYHFCLNSSFKTRVFLSSWQNKLELPCTLYGWDAENAKTIGHDSIQVKKSQPEFLIFYPNVS